MSTEETPAGEEAQASAEGTAPSGEAPSPQSIEQIITELEERAQKLEQDKREIHDRLLRTAADFENYKKRAKREIEDGSREGRDNLVKELIPVIDNLERAIKHANAEDPLAKGVTMVERQLLQVLEKFGVKRFSALGEPFDPAQHDAIQQVETADIAPGTVAQEYAAGYTSNGRLIRPAMVAVAKAPEAAVDGQGESGG
jgi:molecular chaperone GrpE